MFWLDSGQKWSNWNGDYIDSNWLCICNRNSHFASLLPPLRMIRHESLSFDVTSDDVPRPQPPPPVLLLQQ